MNITQGSLKRIIVSQWNSLLYSIQVSQYQEDLERIQGTLDTVEPLWCSLGYGERLLYLRRKLKRKAAHILLQHKEQLSLYQPGKGLWESARKSVQGLTQFIKN